MCHDAECCMQQLKYRIQHAPTTGCTTDIKEECGLVVRAAESDEGLVACLVKCLASPVSQPLSTCIMFAAPSPIHASFNCTDIPAL